MHLRKNLRELRAPFRLLSTATRVSDDDRFLPASAHTMPRLATTHGTDARCVRPTSASQHSRLRAPAPRGFPTRRRARAVRSYGGSAFHDAAYRFGGSARCRAAGHFPPRSVLSDRASGIPVAAPAPFRRARARDGWTSNDAEAACSALLVKGARHPRPEMPSIAGWPIPHGVRVVVAGHSHD